MTTIDIRNHSEEKITSIVFSERDIIEHESTSLINIRDTSCDESCSVFIKDIPNLIKALQKAQELWGDK